jgi:hypothetical protein
MVKREGPQGERGKVEEGDPREERFGEGSTERGESWSGLHRVIQKFG